MNNRLIKTKDGFTFVNVTDLALALFAANSVELFELNDELSESLIDSEERLKEVLELGHIVVMEGGQDDVKELRVIKNVTTSALIWSADDFDSISENLRMSDEITEEKFLELSKMSNEDKVKELEVYISGNAEQIMELIHYIITDGMTEEYANNNQSINN